MFVNRLSCLNLCRKFSTSRYNLWSSSTYRVGNIIDDYVAINPRKPYSTRDRKKRFEQQTVGCLEPSNYVQVQVVGTGAWQGTPRSVLVLMDNFRYLFNCGEGTQRAAVEHRMRLSQVNNIFMTHCSWNNCGGLHGMLLSIDQFGGRNVTFHGPAGLEAIESLSRSLADQNLKIKVDTRDAGENCLYSDTNMMVESVILRPCNESEDKVENDETAASNIAASKAAIVYVCTPHQKKSVRKINLEKMVDLGIPPGSAFRKLNNGESITLEDGRLIAPEDVYFELKPTQKFLVVEVPSEEYMSDLLESAVLRKHSESEQTSLIIHFTPEEVLTSPRYQQWMSSFPAQTQHMILNERSSPVPFIAKYRNQARLNLLNDNIFPLLADASSPNVDTSRTEASSENCVYGEAGLVYNLVLPGHLDEHGWDTTQCVLRPDLPDYFSAADTVEMVMKMEGFPDVLQQTKTAILQSQHKQLETRQYPEIIFLGTGSSIPSQYRNVSGILVMMRPGESILFDCGEGTLSQICTHFGLDKAQDILQSLQAVFISHMHADHHTGLASILSARCKAFTDTGLPSPKLQLLAPWRYNQQVLPFLQTLFPDNFNVETTSTENLRRNIRDQIQSEYKSVVTALQLQAVETVRVNHRQCPHGIVLTFRDGFKLTYSGDTMPCNELVTAGQESDVLIHEASFEDGMEFDAKNKRHSTISQAIKVGQRMNARYTILTHFSQRYGKLPLLPPDIPEGVGIAFDHMRVRPCDLSSLSPTMPGLQAMFVDEIYKMKGVTEQRKRREDARNDDHKTYPVPASLINSLSC